MKLRSHLLIIAAATLLPIIVFTCLVAVLLFQKMRDEQLQNLLGTARALSLALDRSFENGIGTLNALATSRQLRDGDLKSFHEESRRVLAAHEGAEAIVLVDPAGQQIINTRVPFGQLLPRGGGAVAPRVARSRAPAVSSLITGPIVQRPLLVVGVPVMLDGAVKYVLTMALSPAFLQKLLEQQCVPSDSLCTVIDANKNIAARNLDIDKYLGKPAGPSLSAKSAAMVEGVWTGEPQQFEPVYVAHRRSEFSGWTVALGVPISKIHRPLRLFLGAAVAGIMFFVLVAAALAAFFGRRIVNSITTLVEGAKALGAGAVPRLPAAPVAELDDVRRELENAAARRAAMETALRRSEQHLRTIIETEPECVKLVATDGKLLEMNAAGLRMIGAESPHALQGKNIIDLVAPECRMAFTELTQQVLGGEEGKLEFEMIGLGGKRRWVETHAAPLRGAGGEIYALLAVSRDVTERKRAEDALRESDERLKLALAASRMGVWEWDFEANAVFWSPECSEIVGQASVGGPLESFSELLHPDDAAQFRELAYRAVDGNTVFSAECRIRRPNGEVRWVANLGRAEYDAAGKPLRMIGTIHDVTERKRLLAEAQDRAAQLAEADRRKDEFLALLAHELRNPLAPVTSAVAILRLAGLSNPESKRAAETIDEQMRHMTRLIDDLLDVSRITRGALELRREPLQLSRVVQSAVDETRPLIDASGVRLVVDLPAPPIWLNADSIRLTQALSNLLNNAAKYTERGGSIILSAERQGNEVAVSVRDTGIGLPPEKLDHIFEIFAQLDSSLERARGGLGLGLTLVKRLVELHGGKVEAKSEGLGQGSEFVVRLPALPDQSTAESEMATVGAEPAEISLALRTLVADDNYAAAEMAATFFRLKGIPVEVAHDGEEALVAAERFLPDVVLLDLGMPKLNGFEVCRRMRAQPWGQRAVIIAVTGWGRDEDRRSTAEAGFDYHLVKPVGPFDLLDIAIELTKKRLS